jgi:hypothetical protein
VERSQATNVRTLGPRWTALSTGKGSEHRVHLVQKPFDNATPANCFFVPAADGDPEVCTSRNKGAALEFFSGFHDHLLGPAMHRSWIRNPAFLRPIIHVTHRVRKAQCHRESGRALEGKTKADDCTDRRIGGDVQMGFSHGNAVVVDHLDELDIGWRVIDLANVKGVAGAEISRMRFQAVTVVFATGKSPSHDLLGGEHACDPPRHTAKDRGL